MPATFKRDVTLGRERCPASEAASWESPLRSWLEDPCGLAVVAGDFVLREGKIVPEGAVVTNQDEADALPIR